MKRLALPAAASLRTACELAVWRYGWAWLLAALLALVAVAVELGVNAPLAVRIERDAQPLNATPRPSEPSPAAALPVQAEAAERIEAMLRAQGSFESQFRRLVALADKHGVALSRGDYQPVGGGASDLERVHVHLSVGARYPQLRGFVEEALRTLPAVSLDQFAVKREKSDKGSVEIQVRMTFWAVNSAMPQGRPLTLARQEATR